MHLIRMMLVTIKLYLIFFCQDIIKLIIRNYIAIKTSILFIAHDFEIYSPLVNTDSIPYMQLLNPG